MALARAGPGILTAGECREHFGCIYNNIIIVNGVQCDQDNYCLDGSIVKVESYWYVKYVLRTRDLVMTIKFSTQNKFDCTISSVFLMHNNMHTQAHTPTQYSVCVICTSI